MEVYAQINKPPPVLKGTIDTVGLLTQRYGRRAGDMKTRRPMNEVCCHFNKELSSETGIQHTTTDTDGDLHELQTGFLMEILLCWRMNPPMILEKSYVVRLIISALFPILPGGKLLGLSLKWKWNLRCRIKKVSALDIQGQIIESQRALGDATADVDLKSQFFKRPVRWFGTLVGNNLGIGNVVFHRAGHLELVLARVNQLVSTEQMVYTDCIIWTSKEWFKLGKGTHSSYWIA
nr:protein NEN1-like [Tanacetum cinerariifolium]